MDEKRGAGQYETVSVAAMTLTSGRGRVRQADRTRSVSAEGLSLGILMNASVDVDFDNRRREHFAAADGFLLSCREPIEMLHVFRQASEPRIVFLHIPPEALESFGRAASVAGSPVSHDAIQSLRSWKPNSSLLTVAQQIMDCRYTGCVRELYLQGKALELLSMTLNSLDQDGDSASPMSIASRTERLIAARDILLAEYRTPPSLDALSSRVGICTTALTSGFRAMFGMSVIDFIQDQRLEHARLAIVEGRLSVSQAAYSVGLSPAYFSTIFRRRFGEPPSKILRRRQR